MAAEQKERTAKLAEKRQELGEQELRHTVPYGTRQMLDELMRWHEIDEVSEAMQLLVLNGRAEDLPPATPKVKGPSDIIRHYFRQGMRDRLAALSAELGETKDRATIWRLIAYAHSLGAEKSAPLFEIKRHVLDVSENMARKLRQAGFAQSLKMSAEEDGENIPTPPIDLNL
ncbi:hypothetical protein IFT96_23370 [Pseudomonas fluorescens]|uniref:hypothetical protein n=1 Tax=Pseudomonas paracarnis TaxID=2750625 RepID=UPI00177C45F6|nr:hypothetical protein [Pseudomonas paracarnis]MBD8258315.1 hypothetical protein [Pseudomonas fluorescens]MDV3058557.1 hypothetical protein [Pseudomonas paracarnis]